MDKKKKKPLTRDQVAELYADLRRTMNQVKATPAQGTARRAPTAGAGGSQDVAKQIAQSIKQAMASDIAREQAAASVSSPFAAEPAVHFSPTRNKGSLMAILFILSVACMRVTLTALESFGLGAVRTAEASIMSPAAAPANFNREEVRILTQLDQRRAELEERIRKAEARERELDLRDREFAVRVAQLRDLTDRLRGERERHEKKRNTQLEQLANVYGSMNPQEAAHLIEQLDVTIALGLLEKMPEKRIGQILALMNPERALAITRMLSGKLQ